MKWLVVAVVYLGFFGAIAAVGWWAQSAWVLLALLLMPTYKTISRCPKCGHEIGDEEDE